MREEEGADEVAPKASTAFQQAQGLMGQRAQILWRPQEDCLLGGVEDLCR